MTEVMSVKCAMQTLPNEERKKWFYQTYKLNEIPKFRQIRIESTNLCGCNCFMCPHNKMKRKKGTMTISTLENILEQLSYIDYPIQFHLHGFGESLLCRDLPKRISLIVRKNSNFQPFIITTLAYDFDKTWFESLFQNGLKFVSVSMYGYDSKTYEIIHGSKNFDFVVRNLKWLVEFTEKYGVSSVLQFDDFSIYPDGINRNVHVEKKKNFFETFLKNVGFTEENFPIRVIGFGLHNYGNSADWLPKRNVDVPCSICHEGKRKNILQIDWEGNVIPCCFDYDSSYIWGNINHQSLQKIFNSQARYDFLNKVISGKYVPMCDGCPK